MSSAEEIRVFDDRTWMLSVVPRAGTPQPARSRAVSLGTGRLAVAVQDTVVCLDDGESGPTLLWSYETGGQIPGSLGVAPDGSLRAHSSDRQLHAISPAGHPLWPPVDVGAPLGWAAPLVDDEGTTWLSAYTGGVQRVDAWGGGRQARSRGAGDPTNARAGSRHGSITRKRAPERNCRPTSSLHQNNGR